MSNEPAGGCPVPFAYDPNNRFDPFGLDTSDTPTACLPDVAFDSAAATHAATVCRNLAADLRGVALNVDASGVLAWTGKSADAHRYFLNDAAADERGLARKLDDVATQLDAAVAAATTEQYRRAVARRPPPPSSPSPYFGTPS